MPEPVLSAEEMLAWLERTSQDWRKLVESQPEILGLPCDVAKVATVGALLQHIVAVELRYAERLAGLPQTDYAAIPYDSAAAIYATHERAMQLMRAQLAANVEWNERIEFVTRSMGPASSTRKTVFFHALLHGIRHYAQLATLLRQHGVAAGFPMDYLVMDMQLVKA
jgi:uncharacterized damage-inducible protein DinB